MKIENGFVTGISWHTKKRVMVQVGAILKITLDCGNSPKADRIHFIDGHIDPVDLFHDDEQG